MTKKEVKMQQAIIFGGDHQGKIVLEILRSQKNVTVEGFLDDDISKHGTVINGLPVLGGMEWAKANVDRPLAAIVAIGNNDARITIGNQLRGFGVKLINAIHPSAVIMSGTSIGSGNLICAGSIIVTGACLGDDIVVNHGAIVDHDSILHSGAYLSPNVTAGCVSVGRGAFIGIGTTLVPNVTIGDGCIVGAGSLVLSDLPPRVLAFGSPAKVIKELEEPVNWSRILAGLQ